MFCTKGVLKNLAKFTFSFLNKVAGASNIVKKETGIQWLLLLILT